MHFTDVIDFAVNEVTSKVFFIQSKRFFLYDMNETEVEWTFDYRKEFSEELYGIPWNTEHAAVRLIPSLDCWLCIFNKKYIKLVYHKFFMSNFIDLDYQINDFSYIESFNILLFKLTNRKQLEICTLHSEHFFESVDKCLTKEKNSSPRVRGRAEERNGNNLRR